MLKFSDRVVWLVFKKKPIKVKFAVPFWAPGTIFRVILCNKMFLGGQMIIYINCSDKQFNRDLELLKMLQFEKGNSCKKNVRHLDIQYPFSLEFSPCFRYLKEIVFDISEFGISHTLHHLQRLFCYSAMTVIKANFDPKFFI